MSKPKTAVEMRIEEDKMKMKRCKLAHYPDYQTEAIIKHYVDMADVAKAALGQLELIQTMGDPSGGGMMDGCEYRADLIKEAHKKAFGIPLEWINAKSK